MPGVYILVVILVLYHFTLNFFTIFTFFSLLDPIHQLLTTVIFFINCKLKCVLPFGFCIEQFSLVFFLPSLVYYSVWFVKPICESFSQSSMVCASAWLHQNYPFFSGKRFSLSWNWSGYHSYVPNVLRAFDGYFLMTGNHGPSTTIYGFPMLCPVAIELIPTWTHQKAMTLFCTIAHSLCKFCEIALWFFRYILKRMATGEPGL